MLALDTCKPATKNRNLPKCGLGKMRVLSCVYGFSFDLIDERVLPVTDGQTVCREQDAMLNLWFTIAAALRNIFGIVVGLHVFKFGTRSARLTGW